MIVCIYCRRDSCRSHVEHTIVCDSRCVYVFQLWDVRSKIVVVVVVVVVASLCIRLCRCWSLDIIWRHIILCYSGICVYWCVPFSERHVCVLVRLPGYVVHREHFVVLFVCGRKKFAWYSHWLLYPHITHFILNKYCFLSWVCRSHQPVWVWIGYCRLVFVLHSYAFFFFFFSTFT